MLIFVSIAIASFIVMAGAFIFHSDHDLDHDSDSGDHTISIFSVKVVATMTMGFGAAGAIAYRYNAGYLLSSLIGVGFGVFLAAAVYFALSLIVKQQADSLIPTSALEGCCGTVTVEIEAGGLGEVSVSSNGQYSTFVAKGRGGTQVAKGKTVKVVQTIGSQLIVEETN